MFDVEGDGFDVGGSLPGSDVKDSLFCAKMGSDE